MATPQPCRAQLVTQDGRTIECGVSNLTELGAFFHGCDRLSFRQRISVHLFGRALHGVVLFVSSTPPGVVVAFDADLATQAFLLARQPSVGALPEPRASHEAAHPTAPSAAPVPLSSEDLTPLPVVDDLVEITEPKAERREGEEFSIPMLDAVETAEPAHELPPLEGFELEASSAAPRALGEDLLTAAVADLDDASSAPPATTQGGDAPETSLPRPTPALPQPAVSTAKEVMRPAGLPPMSGDRIQPAATKEHIIIPPPPSTELAAVVKGELSLMAEELVVPPLLLEEEGAAGVAPEVEGFATSLEDEVTRTLPVLEADGVTVRFASPQAYTVQFENNLKHGGLVVRSESLEIGTQRMLALSIPGKDMYTVSARVVFHEPGKLGFMVDSLALHKSELALLGG